MAPLLTEDHRARARVCVCVCVLLPHRDVPELLLTEVCVCVGVCGCVWRRDLPEPLLTEDHLETFALTLQLESTEEQLYALKLLTMILPPINRTCVLKDRACVCVRACMRVYVCG